MKIQPRATASVPKYAAVMAAAVVLTGCGNRPVALGGDVPVPDFISESSERHIRSGFARQGINLERSYGTAEYNGPSNQAWFADQEKAVVVCFYFDNSGSAAELEKSGAEQFDWGFACETQYPLGAEAQTACRTAYIEVKPLHETEFSKDAAEQIAKDLLNMTMDETTDKAEEQNDEN
ncbi:MAG: hypothetical protein J5753_05070 [Oscillospiraceae bacterium]|nr:hypothetical protein [Oscillospiraceae bacterium]